MERIKTYIKGLDILIEGGFPQGSTILLSGSAGTGKTIFSLEYLYNAVTKNRERAIYFTFEEKKKSLIEQAQQFNWDLVKLEKNNKLKIISMGVNNINKEYINNIHEIIEDFNPQRIVIDSINALSYLIACENENNSESYIKRIIYSFLSGFKKYENLTSIFISQSDLEIGNSIAEYICDGIITIEYENLDGNLLRNLIIKKMRKTKNDPNIHSMEISNHGIIIDEM